MSALVTSAGPVRLRHELAVPLGLLIAIVFLFAAGNLAGNGVLDAAGRAALGPAWTHGSLLQALAGWIASWFAGVLDQAAAMVLVMVVVAGITAIATFRLLRTNDWPVLSAFGVLALVAGNGLVLQAVTTAAPEFFLMLAAGLLIPAARRLEAVGDVQAIINFGLALPVMLMAGPALVPLIPLLVLAVPLREADARRNPGVFGAMLLVAVVPVLIIVLGAWAMAARFGIGIVELAQPFLSGFARRQGGIPIQALMLMGLVAPVALVPLIHLFVPDRRRKIWTSLLTVALPAYVAVGNSLFAWELAAWTPAAMLLATATGWLAATRVRRWMRWLALALLLAGLLTSWTLARAWAEPPWLDGLLPVQLFGYDIALPLPM